MRAAALVTVAGLLALSGLPAHAQTSTPQQDKAPAITSSKINITAQQRHVIKENLLPGRDSAKTPPSRTIKVGETPPADAELRRIPEIVAEKVPQIRSYSFFIADEQIVLVDMTEKKVVEIVD